MFDPFVRPQPELQIRWELRRQWEFERPKLPPKLYRDHMESVAQFQAWKAEHPRDGTMTVMYRWAPQILAVVASVSFSPILLGAAILMGIERKRNGTG